MNYKIGDTVSGFKLSLSKYDSLPYINYNKKFRGFVLQKVMVLSSMYDCNFLAISEEVTKNIINIDSNDVLLSRFLLLEKKNKDTPVKRSSFIKSF